MSLFWLADCNTSGQLENASNSEFGQRYFVDISAKRDDTKSAAKIAESEKDKTESALVAPIKIEFNGKLVAEKNIEHSEETAFKYSAESYQSQNQFTITDAAGKTCHYDISLEALDFSEPKDVILSRTETNLLPLSRVVKKDEEWWIFFGKNEGGGFKEIAEFNEQRNSLILPPKLTQRLRTGNAVIELAIGVSQDIDTPDCRQATINLQYSSKTSAKVVEQF